jgi:hypothetical protein
MKRNEAAIVAAMLAEVDGRKCKHDQADKSRDARLPFALRVARRRRRKELANRRK